MSADEYRDDTLIADLVAAGLSGALVGRAATLFAMFAVLREQSATERNRHIEQNAKSLERMKKTRAARMEPGAKTVEDGKNAPSSLSSSSSFSPSKREKEEEEKKKESKLLPPKSAPLPAHWEPSAAHFDEGAALGFSHAEILDQAQDMKIWAGANAHRSVARKSSWNLTFSGWMRRTRKTFVGKQRAKPATDGLERSAGQNFDIPPWERVGKSQEQYFADLKKANGHGH